MQQRLLALRYLVSTLAVSLALGLVGFAQTTSPTAPKPAMPSASMAAAAAAPMDMKAIMVADWTRAKAYTKEYLDAMPEDGMSFKPTPEIRSFAEQMLHLTNANFAFAAAATGGTNPYAGKNLEKMEDMKTKAALTKVVMESYDYVISALNGMEMSKASEPIKLFGQNTTRGVAFAKAFEHQTHHRGQTTIYLRLKGVTPPGEKLF